VLGNDAFSVQQSAIPEFPSVIATLFVAGACFGLYYWIRKWRWGIFGASFLFAVMHLTWRSVPELGFVFLAALIGGIYYKTNSLTAPIVAHGVNNVMLVAVLPYLLGL
jgi:membrane protease YdiL (CAAX protease family)